MPQQKVETIEYKCYRCGYKWITRHNGKELGRKPKSCAGCKSSLWDTPRSNKVIDRDRAKSKSNVTHASSFTNGKTLVVNVKKRKEYDIFIGRKGYGHWDSDGYFGNQFEIGKHETGQEVIQKYKRLVH